MDNGCFSTYLFILVDKMSYNERILSYVGSERPVNEVKVQVIKYQRCERLLARRYHEVRPVNCV